MAAPHFRKTAVDDFVAKLKKRMDALGLSPMALAVLIGNEKSYPYIYRVLQRKQTPSFEWAENVCRHVGLVIRVEEQLDKPAARKRKTVA